LEYEEYQEEEEEEDDDDNLGYYPDGVKRTLTDEQIVMFRHSEIQALIKEREAYSEQAQSPTHSHAESPLPPRSETGTIFSRSNFKQTNPNQAQKRRKGMGPAQSKRKAEQAALEAQKRRRRNSSSPLSEPGRKAEGERHNPEDYLSDGDERTYRRKAREEDEINETPIELDY
jgi:hypothetical protein